MTSIILLGDSIFDNGRYVPGEPDVVRQVRARLGPGDDARLLAVDGAVTRDVLRQLGHLPDEATHLVVSAGGNDALGASHLLGAKAGSVGEAVAMLGEAQARFEQDYSHMAEKVAASGRRAALCTIYDTPGSAPQQKVIRSALSLFNDIITRAAFSRSMDLIDLRLICNEDRDYANPIEPSSAGGEKIARAIARFAALPPSESGSRIIL